MRWPRNTKGTKDTKENSAAVIDTRGREIGVTNLIPHDLRRSYAAFLKDSGADLLEIRDCLRHTSAQTTEIYLKRLENTSVKVASRLNLGLVKAA